MPGDELTVQQMIAALENAEEWITRAGSTLDAGGRDRVIAGSGDDTITSAHLIATMDFVNQLAGAVRAALDAIENKSEVVFAKSVTAKPLKLGPVGTKLACDGPLPIVGRQCGIDITILPRGGGCGPLDEPPIGGGSTP